ncbi:MAG: nucleoside-diphosphate sugar epimerase/dehydratase [Candidatus Krumholzibacteriia bacterium]
MAHPPQKPSVRLLIVGAGAAGRALVEQMRREPELGLEPLGFVDDDPALIGTTVEGLPVVDDTRHLVQAADRLAVQEILIAIPSARGSVIRRLILLCKRAGLPFRIVPGLRAIIDGDVRFNQVRSVAPEDLLGRETVRFQVEAARAVVAGKSVMVTGAGGSIGGELCRQLITLEPAELLLLGRGENSIFEIMGELNGVASGTALVPLIADVRDAERLDVLARRHRPQLILHAAAHKHVPLMEAHPEEAVQVNAGGTANLIAFARTVAAERFVLISTDKAAVPSSIMGATKKLAELLVRHAQGGPGTTRFMTVRFGNVLGSRGSVVPFFLKRIAAGKPLPVTHPEMTRYFMTIREAALLVIEAMVLGEAGATYILDMGEPVPIMELARNLLVLSGHDPDHGPGIEIVGVRPGEKLHESLLDPEEQLEDSGIDLIHKARCRVGDPARTAAALPDLLGLARAGDRDALRRRLSSLLERPALCEPPAAPERR